MKISSSIKYNGFHLPWSLKKEKILESISKKKNKSPAIINKDLLLDYIACINDSLYRLENIHGAKVLLHKISKKDAIPLGWHMNC